MRIMDDQIQHSARKTKEQEASNNRNIYEGVTINDQYYELQEVSFSQERLKVHIPTTFVDMSLELVAIKYRNGDQPQIIKTNNAGSVSITLEFIPSGIEDRYISYVKDEAKNIITSLNPSYMVLAEGVEKVAGKNIGFFEFKSQALDIALFNLMFFFTMDHNIIMGVFNCFYDEHEWQLIARQIMKSIRVDHIALELT